MQHLGGSSRGIDIVLIRNQPVPACFNRMSWVSSLFNRFRRSAQGILFLRAFYLTTSRSFVPSLPSSTRKRRISDSVRSTGSRASGSFTVTSRTPTTMLKKKEMGA